MPACPRGHDSADPDWCDVCGLTLGALPAAPPEPPSSCVVCGTPLDGRFCEHCGHDSAAAAVPAPPRAWRAVVRVDGAERHYELSGDRIAIGRRSPARGTAPEIDLAGLDPGVSAAHAVLLARPDGGWDLVDLGSTNGTALPQGPIPAHEPVPLADGTVVRLGAWTTITVTAGR